MIADANLKPVRLKAVREQAGMSKAALFKASGVDVGTIGRIESGRFIPYDPQLTRLAGALGVDDPASLMQPLEAVL